MPEESLCFWQATHRLNGYPDAEGSISEEQWMWHLVQHMRGVRHNYCKAGGGVTRIVDPVGHSVMRIALNEDYEPLTEDEAQLYEKLLVDSLNGNLDAVTDSFDSLKKLRAPYLDPLQPVATVGAFGGHLPIVRFALDRGADVDRDLAFTIQKGSKKTPEMEQYYKENKESLDDKAEIKPDLETIRRKYPHIERIDSEIIR